MTDRLNEITIVSDKSIFDMKAGEVMKTEGYWLLMCPGCGGGHTNLTQKGGWNLTEHEDGTITVSPSIEHKYEEHYKCGAHFFIEKNKIRWV